MNDNNLLVWVIILQLATLAALTLAFDMLIATVNSRTHPRVIRVYSPRPEEDESLPSSSPGQQPTQDRREG